MNQDDIIKVTMADYNVAAVSGILRTTGLGSCVGITLYDPKLKVAGMAHIMLPTSQIAREGNFNQAKYADTAIPLMINKMMERGARKLNLVAKMAGGAQMFQFGSQSESMRIGPRNVESCKKLLQQHAIPLLSEDTGGNFGRTIEFNCSTGMMQIRSVQHGVKEM